MEGKMTVLITGGSRGIGAACANEFARKGYRVIITYRTQKERAQLVLNSLEGEGHKMYPLHLDESQAIEKQMSSIISEFDHIDVLVNNAGIFMEHEIDKVSYDDWCAAWKDILQVNLIGLAQVTYLVAQGMIQKKAGSIIMVSSRGAFRGEPEFPAYGASKGGLNSMSQSLAKSLGRYGISVVAVAPGFVETEMAKDILLADTENKIKGESPFGRIATPSEVAKTICFLADKESSFLSGGIVDINGASFLRM